MTDTVKEPLLCLDCQRNPVSPPRALLCRGCRVELARRELERRRGVDAVRRHRERLARA